MTIGLSKERILLSCSLLGAGIFYTVLAIRSEGLYHFDDATRYLIARYAFAHPSMLWDSLNRPIYAVLAAPFAQYGITAARFANIGIALLSGFVSYLVARELNLQYAWLVPLFVLAQPAFAYLAFSTLSEPTFGLLLILAILFYFKDCNLLSAILASPLAITRPEGLLYIALWAVLLVRRRAFSSLLALFSFPIVWWVAGWMSTASPSAILRPDAFHSSPTVKPYSLFTYLPLLPRVVGPALFLLIGIGIIYGLRERSRLLQACLLLQAGALTCAILFLADQDPQLRYWVPVAPVLGVIGAQGLGFIMERFSGERSAIGSRAPKETLGLVQKRWLLLSIVLAYLFFMTALYLNGGYLIYKTELIVAWLMSLTVLGGLFFDGLQLLRRELVLTVSIGLVGSYCFWIVRPLPLKPDLQVVASAASWVEGQSYDSITSNDPFFWVRVEKDPWQSFNRLDDFTGTLGHLPKTSIAVWSQRGYSRDIPNLVSLFPPDKWSVIKEFPCTVSNAHCSVVILESRLKP